MSKRNAEDSSDDELKAKAARKSEARKESADRNFLASLLSKQKQQLEKRKQIQATREKEDIEEERKMKELAKMEESLETESDEAPKLFMFPRQEKVIALGSVAVAVQPKEEKLRVGPSIVEAVWGVPQVKDVRKLLEIMSKENVVAARSARAEMEQLFGAKYVEQGLLPPPIHQLYLAKESEYNATDAHITVGNFVEVLQNFGAVVNTEGEFPRVTCFIEAPGMFAGTLAEPEKFMPFHLAEVVFAVASSIRYCPEMYKEADALAFATLLCHIMIDPVRGETVVDGIFQGAFSHALEIIPPQKWVKACQRLIHHLTTTALDNAQPATARHKGFRTDHQRIEAQVTALSTLFQTVVAGSDRTVFFVLHGHAALIRLIADHLKVVIPDIDFEEEISSEGLSALTRAVMDGIMQLTASNNDEHDHITFMMRTMLISALACINMIHSSGNADAHISRRSMLQVLLPAHHLRSLSKATILRKSQLREILAQIEQNVEILNKKIPELGDVFSLS